MNSRFGRPARRLEQTPAVQSVPAADEESIEVSFGRLRLLYRPGTKGVDPTATRSLVGDGDPTVRFRTTGTDDPTAQLRGLPLARPADPWAAAIATKANKQPRTPSTFTYLRAAYPQGVVDDVFLPVLRSGRLNLEAPELARNPDVRSFIFRSGDATRDIEIIRTGVFVGLAAPRTYEQEVDLPDAPPAVFWLPEVGGLVEVPYKTYLDDSPARRELGPDDFTAATRVEPTFGKVEYRGWAGSEGRRVTFAPDPNPYALANHLKEITDLAGRSVSAPAAAGALVVPAMRVAPEGEPTWVPPR